MVVAVVAVVAAEEIDFFSVYSLLACDLDRSWLFFVYSLLACGLSDHGEIIYSPFPVRCPRSGGSLKAPLCPPPRPVPRRCDTHQGDYKREESERERQRKRRKKGAVHPPKPFPRTP